MKTKAAVQGVPLMVQSVVSNELIGTKFDYTSTRNAIRAELQRYEGQIFANSVSYQYYALLGRLYADYSSLVNVNGRTVYDNERKIIVPAGVVVEYPIVDCIRLATIFNIIKKLLERSEQMDMITLRDLFYFLRALYRKLMTEGIIKL